MLARERAELAGYDVCIDLDGAKLLGLDKTGLEAELRQQLTLAAKVRAVLYVAAVSVARHENDFVAAIWREVRGDLLLRRARHLLDELEKTILHTPIAGIGIETRDEMHRREIGRQRPAELGQPLAVSRSRIDLGKRLVDTRR